MRAETSVTTTLLHSKAELPMSDSPIFGFSDAVQRALASLRLRFSGFPQLFRGRLRGGVADTCVWRERSLLTEWR